MRTLMFFIMFFTMFFVQSDVIIHLLITPLLKILPVDQELILTELTAPLLIPISLAAHAAALATTPILLYHLWRFAAPAFYKDERRELLFAISLSLLLFITGLCFCFYLVLPYMFQLVVNSTIANVKLMPDMAYTLSFITRMLMIFGLCFQIPLLCLTAVNLNFIDLAGLKKMRPYGIVLAFIVGMILTPPDVLSQIMLAIPLCLLFEGGILLVWIKS